MNDDERAIRTLVDDWMKADVREVHLHGDWAYAWNHLTVAMTPLDGGETSLRAGDVLSVFRKRDGQWLLFRDANLLARQRT